MSSLCTYFQSLFTTQPIAAWTAVLAFVATLAIVVPVVTGYIERLKEAETNRRLVFAALRMIWSRVEAFRVNLGYPAAQYCVGMDVLISRAFSPEALRSLPSAAAEKAYDAAMHCYGALMGADALKARDLSAALGENLYRVAQLLSSALLELDPEGSKKYLAERANARGIPPERK